ncbi:Hypothetical_protein [Hexamita inflata]|uniref:Hypothetical_protein n=1 Tax=Hexamita inflata TaxID=28002 RepID=A0AA86Q942_9EUKA|nr:Hypothetical protein HINF_LOCUS36054 [Hexamita inflata]
MLINIILFRTLLPSDQQDIHRQLITGCQLGEMMPQKQTLCKCNCEFVLNNNKFITGKSKLQNSIKQTNVYVLQFFLTETSTTISQISSQTYIFNNVKQQTNNIYIKLVDNLFAQNVVTLFQYQKEFNHIKIEVCDQQVQSCSQLLTAQTNIRIYNMIIASTENTKISTTGAFQFNVLQSVSKGTHLVNFLLNLTILNSQVSLCLIGSLSEYLIVKGYQVCGQYQSTNLAALGCFSSNASIIKVSQLNVMPSVFEVGNQSSFLFSSVNASTVDLLRIHITQGAAAAIVTRTSIATSNVTYFQFGGLVCQISNSSIVISQLASLSYVKYGTQFVNNSGALVGVFQSPGASCSVSTVNITGLVSGTSAASLLLANQSGVAGIASGNVTFANSFFSLRSDLCSLGQFGLVSFIDVCNLASFMNIALQLQITSQLPSFTQITSYQSGISSVICVSNAVKTYIFSVNVSNSTLTSSYFSGGLVGVASTLYILNSQIQQSNLTSGSQQSASSGALVCAASILFVKQSLLSNLNVFSSAYSRFASYAGVASMVSQNSQIELLVLQNSGLFSSSIYLTAYSGLLSSLSETGTCYLNNVQIRNDNFTAQSTNSVTGAFAAIWNGKEPLVIYQCRVTSIRIKGVNLGIITGINTNKNWKITESCSEGQNYIKDELIINCAAFTQPESICGCE